MKNYPVIYLKSSSDYPITIQNDGKQLLFK